MVVKLMRWPPWPLMPPRKYEVRLAVRSLERCTSVPGEMLAVEVRWKGPKVALISSLRRAPVKRNFTRREEVGRDGVVAWEEEFESLCTLSAYRENAFHPWEIVFTVFNGIDQGVKTKLPVVGRASVNLAEFTSAEGQKKFDLGIPLTNESISSDSSPLLRLSLSFIELRTSQATEELEQRAIIPSPATAPKDELSAVKAGLRKVKMLTRYVSAKRVRKANHVEDFGEDSEGGESDDERTRNSFNYGSLAYVNNVGGSFYSNGSCGVEDQAWVYYSYQRSNVGTSSPHEDPAASASQQVHGNGPKRGILSWRKRKLTFRSPKSRGEPLLKKAYAEEGGDDIDFDRRQLCFDESLAFQWNKMDDGSSANRSSVSEFGDDNFAIGCWETKEVASRDGHMKLQTPVFFASIDQRSEKAAGEGACTALVAVIANWLQLNRDFLPIKSQFDSLVRDGSLEWRNLCDNEMYRQRFPDKHFDLETVLQAEICSLSIVPSKSFIGFFHPDGIDKVGFDFLQGAMSFDEVWDEIRRSASECPRDDEPHIYIVSWNDHFFVLKVESEAYYIIDTLGERLYEGCNQAYILKFDDDTTISKVPETEKSSEEGTTASGGLDSQQQQHSKEEDVEMVCRGKESCKEYIKSFLAAIPIRELQADMKKGLAGASAPLHHRLQVEFHYTGLLNPVESTEAAEETEGMEEKAS
ncbi:hypothetical protein SAY86_015037 [Trapa natans]|uniref:C2 NT-type domain-containing protein n=1 Tax=Trapa natans TaxID=22666 RepID=A0AAN7KQJ2_TRANT|nr:hypothetical protein SAY86_015037 [Trapa natans]